MRRVAALVAVLVAVAGSHEALASGIRTAAPSANSKATFGIGPASAKGLDGRAYLNYSTDPGGGTSDHVAVRNYSVKPLTIRIYAADATASGQGEIGFAPERSPGIDASRWFTFNGGHRTISVRVPGRTTRIVSLAIAIPRNASPGDHLAGVIAAFTGRAVTTNGEQINLDQRIALRALFRVSGAVRSQLVVDHLNVDYHDNWNPFGAGSATITYSVRNAGNVLLGGRQNVTLTGIFGSTGSMTKLVQVPLLLPGASVPVRVAVHDVWPEFLMHARVAVKPLPVAGAVDPPLRTTNAVVTFWAVPWALLILIVLIGLAAYVARRWWRKRAQGTGRHHRPQRDKAPALVGSK